MSFEYKNHCIHINSLMKIKQKHLKVKNSFDKIISKCKKNVCLQKCM